MPSSLFILGGVRSGKSRFAIESAAGRAPVFVATAQARDPEMARRIARHRRERPASWSTVEEPFEVVAALEGLIGRADTVVVDCVTLWVANRQDRGDSDEAIVAGADAVARLIRRRVFDLAVVSNEVGQGVHPATAAGLRFTDLLGSVNQRVAAACDRVVLMVAGVPLSIKDAPARRDEATLQAP